MTIRQKLLRIIPHVVFLRQYLLYFSQYEWEIYFSLISHYPAYMTLQRPCKQPTYCTKLK